MRALARAALVALVAAAVGAPVRAQSLMVGDDGAVHLDQFDEVQANDPVIVQQNPELVGPAFAQPAPMSTPWPPGLGASVEPYGGCSVPFVPCAPYSAVVIPAAPLPIAYSIFAEALYLHPTGVDVAHAQQLSLLGTPLGQVAVADFHYEPGARVGGDIATSATTSLAATYTWFESNSRSSLNPSGVPGGTVGSLVFPHGILILPTTGPVSARNVVDFQLADVEFRSRLLQGPRHWINGGLGLRYGHLEQEFGQVGFFPGAFPGDLVAQSDVDFDGGGPKLALDGGRAIGNRGFSIYASSSVSPLAGEFHSLYSLTNTTTGTQLAAASWKDDRVVTLLDYEAGLAWTSPRKRWRFSAGYTQSFWFNAVTNNAFIDAVQANDFSDVSDTIMFDGPTARIEHLW